MGRLVALEDRQATPPSFEPLIDNVATAELLNLGIQLTPVTLCMGVGKFGQGTSHDRLVRGRLHSYGLLQQAIEKLSPRAGFATVKAERKLIQIVVQVSQAYRTLVGSYQPALQQREHQMHPRQKFGRGLLVLLQHRHLVSVPFHLQTGISFPLGN